MPTWQNWGKLQVKLEFSIPNWGKLRVKLEFCKVGGVKKGIKGYAEGGGNQWHCFWTLT